MDKSIPIGSSRVENQMTCEGGLSVAAARALRMERIALKPWDRGWAAPKTFKLPILGALKFGAPWMFKSRSRARPSCA